MESAQVGKKKSGQEKKQKNYIISVCGISKRKEISQDKNSSIASVYEFNRDGQVFDLPQLQGTK